MKHALICLLGAFAAAIFLWSPLLPDESGSWLALRGDGGEGQTLME
jgi:hypothetical protein